MQNVVDFFILKQVYDQSLERDWRPGKHLVETKLKHTIRLSAPVLNYSTYRSTVVLLLVYIYVTTEGGLKPAIHCMNSS